MEAPIFIIHREGRPSVSARELYRFLELNPAHYARWATSNILENPFAVQGEDWEVFTTDGENSEGRPSQDYALTLPFAKKLAMMSKSAKAEQVRDYFIECERIAHEPAKLALDFSDPLTAARLYIEAETAKRAMEAQLREQAPAVAFARQVEVAHTDTGISSFAKMCGWGPNKLFKELRKRGILFKRDGDNVPKQELIQRGYFKVRQTVADDYTHARTMLTGKGVLWLSRILKVNITPMLLDDVSSHQKAA